MTTPRNSVLYRTEATEHAGEQSFGTVLISQPLASRLMMLSIIFFTCTIISFLHYGQYARKVTVEGYLEPAGGVSRVYPPKKGIAEKILFTDGDFVKKGQPLIWVKVPYLLVNGEEVHKKLLLELSRQKAELILTIDRGRERLLIDNNWHYKRITSLGEERKQIRIIQALQISRYKLFEKQQSAYQKLKEEKYASSAQLLKSKADYLNERKETVKLLQRLTQIESEITDTEYHLNVLPIAFRDKMSVLAVDISDINRRITEIRGQSEYLIKAPLDGIITANNIRVGGAVSPEKSILAILPNQSQLVAWLLIPSRAAGFISNDQVVRIMYDSFPYQQFGTQEGSIVSMSNVVVHPRDIKGPTTTSEPVFMAKVRLSKLSITVFGKEQSLQADMLLTADIIQAKRSILDWMFEPLYTLRGRT